MKADYELIERIKAHNEISGACEFNFFDEDGGYASETNKPFTEIEIGFADGTTFKINAATLEAMKAYEFKLESVREQ